MSRSAWRRASAHSLGRPPGPVVDGADGPVHFLGHGLPGQHWRPEFRGPGESSDGGFCLGMATPSDPCGQSGESASARWLVRHRRDARLKLVISLLNPTL